MSIICEHGHLARSCDLCFYGKRVGELEAEVERLRRVVGGTEMCIMHALDGIPKDTSSWRMLNATRKNLANEGSKECRKDRQ